MKQKPIYVTQPFLPPLEEFIPSLQAIWDSKVLTNGGQFHQRLEKALCAYLGVQHLSLFTNATIALITALQAMRISGEVITTPYSFAATSHSILWNGLTPVFVDIDPISLNIDPRRIEEAITPRTTAIMPVHCYGQPCDVDAIRTIAMNHGLKVIYDAAHSFGVDFHGESLLNHGDLSVLSFHATKVFNTFEGGAIICHDIETKQHIDRLKNFGYVDEISIVSPGINGKMSEIHAAFGLLQLNYIEEALQQRRLLDAQYRRALASVKGIGLLPPIDGQETNFSYFPIRVQKDYPTSRDGLYQKLKDSGIFSRRYFYPLISDLTPYRHLPSAVPATLPIAQQAAAEILCLPIYPGLTESQIDSIVQIIAN
jgi:dTDP-4-amino-4,6-dideoxygalactose transaminase